MTISNRRPSINTWKHPIRRRIRAPRCHSGTLVVLVVQFWHCRLSGDVFMTSVRPSWSSKNHQQSPTITHNSQRSIIRNDAGKNPDRWKHLAVHSDSDDVISSLRTRTEKGGGRSLVSVNRKLHCEPSSPPSDLNQIYRTAWRPLIILFTLS